MNYCQVQGTGDRLDKYIAHLKQKVADMESKNEYETSNGFRECLWHTKHQLAIAEDFEKQCRNG